MYFSFRLFGITRGYRSRIILAAFAGLFAIICGIGRLALSGVVIARVFNGESFSTLIPQMIVISLLVILRALSQYVRDMLSHRVASEIKIGLRQRLCSHLLGLGPGYFDRRRTGDVLVFLVDGVENLEAFFGQYLPQFFVAAVAPIIIFVFMVTLDLQIGVIILFSALATFFLPSWLHRMHRHLSLARRDTFGALGAEFLDSIQGITTLKGFGQSRRRGEMLSEKAREVYRSTMKVFLVDGISSAVTIVGVSGGASLALAWGAIRVGNGDLELQSLLIILMLGAEVFRPLRELTQLYHQGMTAMASAEGVFGVFDSRIKVVDVQTESGNKELPVPGNLSDIVFENVTLKYDQGKRSAIENLSFTLRAGETLGLVGASGAGKSTVVWLLLRFLDPQKGRIYLGGRDLPSISLDVLRSQIAVVTQDTYLFNGTIAENLRLGRIDATEEEIVEAARSANAHEFISDLKDGYETNVGERGVKLSGGQRQRIAIARALLKSAPILVLDEALSNVDADNEADIQSAIDRLTKGKTTLIIAHRLSSVVKADRILVLDKGALVESGTHRELVGSRGMYSRLMSAQQFARDENFLNVDGIGKRKNYIGDDNLAKQLDISEQEIQTTEISIWEVCKRLLRLVKEWSWELILSLLSGLTHHSTNIGLGAIGAILVGRIYTGDTFGELLVYLGVFVIICALARWVEAWASHDLAYRLLAEMRIDMYNELEPLAPAYTNDRSSGDLASVAGGDVESIENFYAHVITPAIVALVLPLAVIITLLFVAWPLVLALLPFLSVAAISPFFAQQKSERLGLEMRQKLGELNAFLVDGIQGMREISAFGAGDLWLNQTKKKGEGFSKYRLGFLKQQAFQGGIIESVTALGGLSVLATGAFLASEEEISRSVLPLTTLLALSSFAPVTELASTLRQLMETIASARRIFQIQDEPVVIMDGPGVGLPNHVSRVPSLLFENVSFSYSKKNTSVLREINFSVKSGQTVALVGHSGAGKTTIANLLMRFWDPDEGSIFLGGYKLKQFTLGELRQNIAMVSQDTYLFNASIIDNLRMAKHDATEAEIQNATTIANAHEFIESFPDRYDTEIGERGIRLSGGQRQRLSIARAVLKDAPVLILDEATSHLDMISEQQVREAFRNVTAGRTTLVIAHRLSTVRDSDHIVVLNHGRIDEEGTHEFLLKSNGAYSRLVSTQILGTSG